jgi:hypothetical protein
MSLNRLNPSSLVYRPSLWDSITATVVYGFCLTFDRSEYDEGVGGNGVEKGNEENGKAPLGGEEVTLIGRIHEWREACCPCRRLLLTEKAR